MAILVLNIRQCTAFGLIMAVAHAVTTPLCLAVFVQPSTRELAKREDFPTQPFIPADFIRKNGGTFSSTL